MAFKYLNENKEGQRFTFPGFNELHSILEGKELIWLVGLRKAALQKMAGYRKHCLWTGWLKQSEASSNRHVFRPLSQRAAGRWEPLSGHDKFNTTKSSA